MALPRGLIIYSVHYGDDCNDGGRCCIMGSSSNKYFMKLVSSLVMFLKFNKTMHISTSEHWNCCTYTKDESTLRCSYRDVLSSDKKKQKIKIALKSPPHITSLSLSFCVSVHLISSPEKL